jgi:hypothetical protein
LTAQIEEDRVPIFAASGCFSAPDPKKENKDKVARVNLRSLRDARRRAVSQSRERGPKAIPLAP